MHNFDGFKDRQGNCKTGLRVLDKVAEMTRKKIDENRKSTSPKLFCALRLSCF